MENKQKDYFPQRLKEAMEKAEINQVELAKKVGIAQSGISFYLNGKRVPRLNHLRKMARILDVDALWLIGHDPETETEDLVGKYFSLDGADQAKVMGYMEALLSAQKYTKR